MAKLAANGLVYTLWYTKREPYLEGVFTSLHRAKQQVEGDWRKQKGDAIWNHCHRFYTIEATPINERLGGS